MSAPKVHIGRSYGHQGLRTHRTLNSAFGPYSRLTVESTSDRVDRIVGRFCFVIVVTAILALIVNAAFGGI
jgi:hypothetical protein